MNSTFSTLPILHDLVGSNPHPYLLAAAVALVIPLSSFFLLRASFDGTVYDIGGIPIASAWTFFSKRYDFMSSNLQKTGGMPFRFKVLHHRVVGFAGASARKGFFNEPGLNLQEGYKILMGALPQIDDIGQKTEAMVNPNSFLKRLALLARKDRIANTLPVLLEDINRRMLGWGKEGKINPFKEVYDLVFQMTVRMSTCHDLATNPETIERMAKLYWTMEKSATPTALLLPWFPSQAKKVTLKATTDLYLLLHQYVTERRNAGAETLDPIDILIQNGDTDNDIITASAPTIINIVFAGVVNTGMNSSWALLHLGVSSEWRDRAVSELKHVIKKYTEANSSEPFHKQLALIPLNAWDDELPSLDLIIRETIRMSMGGTALRRNLGTDITIQETTIKRGDLLAYCTADVHMNPEIYSNPQNFDPARFEEGREEDQKSHFAYLGWGAGRHPCAGVKVAKLEIKLILAMLLLGYDYTLEDDSGKPTHTLPQADYNDIQQPRPLGKPVYMKFKRVRD